MQVRYALGYHQLGEGEFELRTIYNFRQRLVKHLEETSENLIEKAFEQITDEQIKAFQFETLSYRGFQKWYGRSVRRRAPGKFMALLKRKAERAGAAIKAYDPRKARHSQWCPPCGRVKKKPLTQRGHACSLGWWGGAICIPPSWPCAWQETRSTRTMPNRYGQVWTLACRRR
jgi:hypothetical protein